MSKLYLLRHAKAGWAAPGMRDFDRPLDASGQTEAGVMGATMRSRGYVPDLTLCSNARRARETLEHLAGETEAARVVFLDELYGADAAGYLDLIRDNGEGVSLLVIGHNPMMEDLAMAVSGDGDQISRATLDHGFPTAALAVVRFDGELTNAARGTGYLEAFLTPADL